jgi:AraC-like DNA-binding protein
MPVSRLSSVKPEQSHLLADTERTPQHSHPVGHLVYPARGVLSLVTPAGTWIAPPSRAVWVPAGHAHGHRAHGSTDMRIVYVDAALVSMLGERPRVLDVSALAREAMLTLTDTASTRNQAARDRLRRVVLDEFVAAPELPLHLPKLQDPRLRALAQLMATDLSNPQNLAELGHRVGAAERTLSRLFRTETGMGFRQWRTQLRVHHALAALADGASVLDTATACGWANPSDFIDAFTRIVGQTPGSYQRSLRLQT